MTPLRLGIIGCGAMGSNHQAVFDSLIGTIEVTATVDIDIEKANSAKEILHAKFATTDYREIWPHVDAVLIATADTCDLVAAEAVGCDFRDGHIVGR